MAVTWNYNGSNQMQATLSASTVGKNYKLSCNDLTSTEATVAGTGSAITLTVSNVGGLSADDQFSAVVYSLDDNDVYDANVFKYGSSSTTGVGIPGITWNWDGTSVTASFTSSVSDSYQLLVNYISSASFDGNLGLGSGTSVSLTATPLDPINSAHLIATISDQTTNANNPAIATRVFTVASTGAGSGGSPTSGGTDTGVAPTSGGGDTLTGSPYTGYAPSFTIVNMDHGGTAISTITPVANSLEWTYRLTQVGGPGDAQWEVALSDANLAADDFAPLRTDWKLVMDGVNELCAGIMTSVNMVSESDSGVFGVVRCQGLDWLHYLEQPYGFDYTDVASDQRTNQLSSHDRLWRIFTTTASGAVAGVTYAATQQDVVDDLLSSLSGYVSTVGFTAQYNGTGWSEGVNMNIGFGDDQSVLDMIVSLASLGDPYGFDMFVAPDKTIRMWASRRVDPSGATALYTLDDSSIVAPPLDWTNNGPNSTDTVMLGMGSSNTRTVGFDTYSLSRSTYRQWVRIAQEDFPDAVDIAKAAGSAGYWDRFPHKDLKVTIRPDLLDATDARLGFTNMLGEAIAVNYNVTPYHHINANFWITEQHYYSPDGCNWLCDLTLSQIYTTSATPNP